MLGRLLSLADRLRRDERGSALPLVGLGVVTFFGFGALAIDTGRLYVTRHALQVTADAAALAAVRELPDAAAVAAVARRVAAANMAPAGNGEVLRAADVETGTWDRNRRTFTRTATDPDAVRVTTRRAGVNGNPLTTFLAGVLGVSRVDLSASATALYQSPAPLCILVLHPTQSAALKVWGSARLAANDCAIQVNSTAGDAVTVGGSGSITALQTLVVGGVSGTNITPAAKTGRPPVPDPLAALPAPPPGACAASNQFGGTNVKVYPGTYCGGLKVKSNSSVILQPGIYVVDNGPFDVQANSRVTGTGVLIYLKGPNGRIELSGGPDINLSAPTGGTYAGVVFFAQRGRSGVTHRLRGNPNLRIEGILYTPSDHLDYSGNTGTAITMLITNTVEYQGNSSFQRYADRTTVPIPDHFDSLKGAASIVH